jgi:hypothetical protein
MHSLELRIATLLVIYYMWFWPSMVRKKKNPMCVICNSVVAERLSVNPALSSSLVFKRYAFWAFAGFLQGQAPCKHIPVDSKALLYNGSYTILNAQGIHSINQWLFREPPLDARGHPGCKSTVECKAKFQPCRVDILVGEERQWTNKLCAGYLYLFCLNLLQ